MRSPFRFVDLRRLAVCVCFGSVWLAGAASERVAEALRGKLPHYDPAIRATAEMAKAAADAVERSPVLRPGAASESLSPRPTNLVTDPNVVQLEPFTVRGKRSPRAVVLPRLAVPKPAAAATDVSDPYLSPSERARRLRRKHLNVLASLLNPGFFGGGLAGESEARERYSGQLNGLADEIELAAATGASAEELKQLRELYLQLYMARPK